MNKSFSNEYQGYLISCMPQYLTDNCSTLVQLMTCSGWATIHYDGLVNWCINVLLGHNELIKVSKKALWLVKADQKNHQINTQRPKQNAWHLAEDIFNCNLLNEKLFILIEISLNFVPNGLIDDNSVMVSPHYLNQWWQRFMMLHGIIRL